MEVEEHHLTLQIRQMTHLAFVVREFDVQHTGLLHPAGFDGLVLLGLYDTLVLHALDGDVMQVLSALGVGVVGIPAGGHGGKDLDIVLVVAGIEEQHVAQRLEQREIGV